MLEQRHLGDLAVSAIGLGCVGMSAEYGVPQDWNEATSLNTLERAFELGISFYDTADSYGPFTNETLLAKFISNKRQQVVISTKAGLILDETSHSFVINGRPDHLTAACKDSLRRLNIDAIDLYFLHRVDPDVPIEESWGALVELQEGGYIKHLGLCEVETTQLETVHQIGSVTAVQSEFSLWTRGPLSEVLPWCETNGVGFVPYSPLGRGFLTGAITSAQFDAGDIRSSNPRFTAAAIAANQAIINGIKTVADRHEATLAQIAIAWILAQGKSIVPIPGTKRVKYLEENAAATALSLSKDDLALLDNLPEAVGSRY